MKRVLTFLSCFYLISCVLVVALLAFTVKPAGAEGAQAFSISPPLIELQTDPGQTVKATVKFTNVSDGELLIKTAVNDFGPKNETGDPNVILEDVANTAYSLRQWISSPPPFKIKAHESKTIDFPISVPKDAEPGGHYAVIRFSGTAPELEESGVALTASIGTLVLLQVSGDIQEKASIIEFGSGKQLKNGSFENRGMFETGPIIFMQRIKNEGNVHVKPTGTIEISNMFGRSVDTLRINGNPTDPKDVPKSILPDSIRRFEQKLDRTWMFGRYTATVKLSYGQGQQPLEQTISFWVIPYKFIVVVIAVATALFFILRFAIKKYNEHIISKARGGRGPNAPRR